MVESPEKIYVLATLLTLLAIIAVILRFYSLRINNPGWSWDGCMILLALLFTVGQGIGMFFGAALGNLGRHTPISSEGAPIFDQRAEVFMAISLASQLTQTLAFGFTKLAVLYLYKRIFWVEKTFRFAVWTMIGLVVAWTVSFFFANLLQCLPISEDWTGWTSKGCIETTKMYLAQAFSDVLTDVMILSMPIPCIWALQITTKQKIGVMFMFLLGVLVVGAGVAKLVVFYRIANDIPVDDVDLSYILTPTVYWPMVESSLGIVGACLPVMRPLFTGLGSKRVTIVIQKKILGVLNPGSCPKKRPVYTQRLKNVTSNSSLAIFGPTDSPNRHHRFEDTKGTPVTSLEIFENAAGRGNSIHLGPRTDGIV